MDIHNSVKYILHLFLVLCYFSPLVPNVFFGSCYITFSFMRPSLKQYQTAVKLVYSNSFYRCGISKGQVGWHGWYSDLLQSGQSTVEYWWRRDFL